MPFVGGTNTRITDTGWRMAKILEKLKNRYISAAARAILTKFGLEMQFNPLDRIDR